MSYSTGLELRQLDDSLDDHLLLLFLCRRCLRRHAGSLELAKLGGQAPSHPNWLRYGRAFVFLETVNLVIDEAHLVVFAPPDLCNARVLRQACPALVVHCVKGSSETASRDVDGIVSYELLP
jgi:hypothetical protein